MNELSIEWRHYVKAGATCNRCAATGSSVSQVVSELTQELSAMGVSVTFVETALPAEMMAQSNLILLNGLPLEAILDNATADENLCQSCSCLTGSETSCRTVEYQGKTYEEIPPELIRLAAFKVLKLNQR